MTPIKILVTTAAAAALGSGASALTIVTVEAPGVQATTVAARTGVESFDGVSGYTAPYVSTFGGSAFAGTFDGVLSSRADVYGGAGGTGRYDVVQGVQRLTLSGAATDYFGLWASALDGGNSVAFYKGGNLVDTINLVSVPLQGSYYGNPNAAFLNQNGGEKYAFFNFAVTGGYDRVDLIQNNGGGFELDNITVGTLTVVPEPATWALMIIGFGLVGWRVRRRGYAVA